MTSEYNFQKAREAWGDANPPVTPRGWVGLTDEEIQAIVNMVATGTYQTSDTFARAIEAKLKEKNT